MAESSMDSSGLEAAGGARATLPSLDLRCMGWGDLPRWACDRTRALQCRSGGEGPRSTGGCSGKFLLPVLIPEGSGAGTEMLSSLGKCVSGLQHMVVTLEAEMP